MAQFKLLPSTPPPQVVESYQSTLDLPEPSLRQVNEWLTRHISLLSTLDYDEILFQMEGDLDLPHGDQVRILNLIFTVGTFIADDDKFSDALDDLNSLGISDEGLGKFRILMEDLRFPEGETYSKVQRAVSTAIPRVVDVRAVCDLRAVFEEVATPDSDESEIDKLHALVPVVILSMDIEDESRNIHSVVLQFSETSFTRFRRIISNAERQLARIKEIGKTAPLDLSGGE